MSANVERRHINRRGSYDEAKMSSVKPQDGSLGLTGWRLSVKYVGDIILTIIAMPICIPISLFVALAIKLDSSGPVFFKQTRVGKDGKLFSIYKFRSMYDGSDASQMLTSLESLNEADGPVFKIRNDPRVTKIGSLLRRTSLDEVPQLLNILRGEMSIVGPRPALPCEVAAYGIREKGRLAVRPGLTCLWQVQGRSNIAFDKWMDLDLEYIANQSLWLDFKIIMKTVPAVLLGKGAW